MRYIFVFILVSFSIIGCRSGGDVDQPALIVVLTDVTGSTAAEKARAAYRTNINQILETAAAGDSLYFGWITTSSIAQLDAVRLALPEEQGWLLSSRLDKAAARKERKNKREKVLQKIQLLSDTTRKAKQTDIMSALHWAGQIFERSNRKRKILVVQSDMIESSVSYDFDTVDFSSEEQIKKIIAAERKLGRIHDLEGVRIHVVGAGALQHDSRKIFQIRKFWIRYFKEAGATVKTYGGQLPRLR